MREAELSVVVGDPSDRGADSALGAGALPAPGPQPQLVPQSTPQPAPEPPTAAQASPLAPRPLAGSPVPLLGFFTRLPLGAGAPLDSVVRAFPLVPMVGWVTGLIGGVLCLLLVPVLPPVALAPVVLALVVGLTGLNQTDGLLDLGDGLMVHGDAARRRQVMHDHSAGVGAVAMVLFTYLVSVGALAGLLSLLTPYAGGAGSDPRWFTAGAVKAAAAVYAGEVLCRLPYIVISLRGRSSHAGLGATFVAGFESRHAAVGVAAALPGLVAAAWLGVVPLVLGVLAAVAVAVWLVWTSERLLGGVGGDVMGASQELGRAAILLALCLGLGLEQVL